MNSRWCIVIGGLLGALAVMAGAFGAHGLEKRLAADLLQTYETAVRYQLFHALAMVLTGLVLATHDTASGRVAAWAFLLGTLLFSGCLYGWIFTQSKPLVMVVPIGGVALIVGWLALALAGWSYGGGGGE